MKRGEELPPKTCDNPVAHEYELGHLAGLDGYAGDRARRRAHARRLRQRRSTRRGARHLTSRMRRDERDFADALNGGVALTSPGRVASFPAPFGLWDLNGAAAAYRPVWYRHRRPGCARVAAPRTVPQSRVRPVGRSKWCGSRVARRNRRVIPPGVPFSTDDRRRRRRSARRSGRRDDRRRRRGRPAVPAVHRRGQELRHRQQGADRDARRAAVARSA